MEFIEKSGDGTEIQLDKPEKKDQANVTNESADNQEELSISNLSLENKEVEKKSNLESSDTLPNAPMGEKEIEKKTEFERAADFMKASGIKVTDAQKLEFYALFKQHEEGDVTTSRPGMFNPVNRAKWDAWKKKEGISKDSCASAYIELVDSIQSNWRDQTD
eukprot:CAMPEP_0182417972 /NCGR_PEP_ID=MMETSP1167-20130531/2432_1 /TAXON_ID=2988 /ORGANISM="Mallomonas Sp, Strain CCMP3275" /LENGTH=161 /DNA_ID=CAMNT_0024591893 /DNA_START=59 /DNA_END=544 /DNA_ORIENTATION=-